MGFCFLWVSVGGRRRESGGLFFVCFSLEKGDEVRVFCFCRFDVLLLLFLFFFFFVFFVVEFFFVFSLEKGGEGRVFCCRFDVLLLLFLLFFSLVFFVVEFFCWFCEEIPSLYDYRTQYQKHYTYDADELERYGLFKKSNSHVAKLNPLNPEPVFGITSMSDKHVKS